MNAAGLRLRTRDALAVICAILLAICSLDVAGTSRWDEGPADFPAGTASNVRIGDEEVRLDRNLAYPGSWTKKGERTVEPVPRTGHAMAYDSANQRTVLFGGHGGSYLGDTWTFDSSINTWTRMDPAQYPIRLDGAAMAYDSLNGLLVLFGGGSFSSQYGYRYFNDTWVYNASTDRWTQRFPAGAPSPRTGHTLTFDPQNGVFVLFGGDAYDQSLGAYLATDETWTYNASTDNWGLRSPAVRPSARLHHAAAFDSESGEVVLFGGWGGTGWNGTGFVVLPWLGDTWTYNVSFGLWTNRTPPASPEARSEHAMSYDAASGSTVVFGGYRATSQRVILDDTWTYDSGTNIWTEKTPPGSPFPQYGHAMAYDSSIGASVLFSGCDEHGNVSETWSYDAGQNRWTNLIPQSWPSPRSNQAMAYDSGCGKVVLFGGQFAWGCANDTWSYESESNTWTPAHPSAQAPSPREGHALACDIRNGVLVLFGGSDRQGALNDTWTYAPATNTWVNMDPPSAPSPRTEHAMVYDDSNGELLLFGGVKRQYAPYQIDYLGDTWTYNVSANRWTQRAAQPAPSARSNHALGYDSSRGTAVLFGGIEKGGMLGDTWTYNSSRGLWSNLTPATSPRKGFDYAMAYGGPSSDVLLFGGWDGVAAGGGDAHVCYPYPNETWAYRTATNTWTNRTHPPVPGPRFSAQMAYDIAFNAVVMFGGYSYEKALGDTWVFGSRAYFTDGTYTSQPFDTGGSASFGAIRWEAAAPDGTSVRLQLRTAKTKAGLDSAPFTGPGGTAGTYYTASGQRIGGAHNGSRWAQYRACLTTVNISETPELESVSISYNLLPNITLISPAGGENWTGIRRICWTASDPDNDSLSFDIILLQGSGSILLASGLSNLTDGWDWDTSAVPNSTCRIRLVARDDYRDIPLVAEATSPELSIFHPGPPNHAPTVELLSPADGSIVNESTVRFRWRGEDMDGDPLIYNLTYWIGSPGERGPASVVTFGTFFNATIPDDGATCYWNVSAFDGRDRSAPSPPWRFVINRTPPNRLPVITSTAPSSATAGAQYQYLMTANDPDGDSLSYSFLSRPQGMVLGPVLPNNTGIRILWTPARAQAGVWNATVEVSDGRGGRADQTFSIQVEVIGPGCAIIYPASGATVKGTLRVNGTAAKGSAEVARVEVRIDDGPWKDASGTLNWSFDIDTTRLSNSNHTIEARSTDGELLSEPAAVPILVVNEVPAPKPPGVTLEGSLWWVLALVLCVAGLTALLIFKRRTKEGRE